MKVSSSKPLFHKFQPKQDERARTAPSKTNPQANRSNQQKTNKDLAVSSSLNFPPNALGNYSQGQYYDPSVVLDPLATEGQEVYQFRSAREAYEEELSLMSELDSFFDGEIAWLINNPKPHPADDILLQIIVPAYPNHYNPPPPYQEPILAQPFDQFGYIPDRRDISPEEAIALAIKNYEQADHSTPFETSIKLPKQQHEQQGYSTNDNYGYEEEPFEQLESVAVEDDEEQHQQQENSHKKKPSMKRYSWYGWRPKSRTPSPSMSRKQSLKPPEPKEEKDEIAILFSKTLPTQLPIASSRSPSKNQPLLSRSIQDPSVLHQSSLAGMSSSIDKKSVKGLTKLVFVDKFSESPYLEHLKNPAFSADDLQNAFSIHEAIFRKGMEKKKAKKANTQRPPIGSTYDLSHPPRILNYKQQSDDLYYQAQQFVQELKQNAQYDPSKRLLRTLQSPENEGLIESRGLNVMNSKPTSPSNMRISPNLTGGVHTIDSLLMTRQLPSMPTSPQTNDSRLQSPADFNKTMMTVGGQTMMNSSYEQKTNDDNNEDDNNLTESFDMLANIHIDPLYRIIREELERLDQIRQTQEKPQRIVLKTSDIKILSRFQTLPPATWQTCRLVYFLIISFYECVIANPDYEEYRREVGLQSIWSMLETQCIGNKLQKPMTLTNIPTEFNWKYLQQLMKTPIHFCQLLDLIENGLHSTEEKWGYFQEMMYTKLDQMNHKLETNQLVNASQTISAEDMNKYQAIHQLAHLPDMEATRSLFFESFPLSGFHPLRDMVKAARGFLLSTKTSRGLGEPSSIPGSPLVVVMPLTFWVKRVIALLYLSGTCRLRLQKTNLSMNISNLYPHQNTNNDMMNTNNKLMNTMSTIPMMSTSTTHEAMFQTEVPLPALPAPSLSFVTLIDTSEAQVNPVFANHVLSMVQYINHLVKPNDRWEILLSGASNQFENYPWTNQAMEIVEAMKREVLLYLRRASASPLHASEIVSLSDFDPTFLETYDFHYLFKFCLFRNLDPLFSNPNQVFHHPNIIDVLLTSIHWKTINRPLISYTRQSPEIDQIFASVYQDLQFSLVYVSDIAAADTSQSTLKGNKYVVCVTDTSNSWNAFQMVCKLAKESDSIYIVHIPIIKYWEDTQETSSSHWISSEQINVMSHLTYQRYIELVNQTNLRKERVIELYRNLGYNVICGEMPSYVTLAHRVMKNFTKMLAYQQIIQHSSSASSIPSTNVINNNNNNIEEKISNKHLANVPESPSQPPPPQQQQASPSNDLSSFAYYQSNEERRIMIQELLKVIVPLNPNFLLCGCDSTDIFSSMMEAFRDNIYDFQSLSTFTLQSMEQHLLHMDDDTCSMTGSYIPPNETSQHTHKNDENVKFSLVPPHKIEGNENQLPITMKDMDDEEVVDDSNSFLMGFPDEKGIYVAPNSGRMSETSAEFSSSHHNSHHTHHHPTNKPNIDFVPLKIDSLDNDIDSFIQNDESAYSLGATPTYRNSINNNTHRTNNTSGPKSVSTQGSGNPPSTTNVINHHLIHPMIIHDQNNQPQIHPDHLDAYQEFSIKPLPMIDLLLHEITIAKEKYPQASKVPIGEREIPNPETISVVLCNTPRIY